MLSQRRGFEKAFQMAGLGMLFLGAFIGWVIAYALYQVKDWKNPAHIFAAVTGAAVSGVVLVFIKYADPGPTGLFFYPIGLAYGALLNCLGFYIADSSHHFNEPKTILGMFTLVIASCLLLSLFFIPYVQGAVKNATSALQSPPAVQSPSPNLGPNPGRGR
jgi:hypothetical protein